MVVEEPPHAGAASVGPDEPCSISCCGSRRLPSAAEASDGRLVGGAEADPSWSRGTTVLAAPDGAAAAAPGCTGTIAPDCAGTIAPDCAGTIAPDGAGTIAPV